MKLPTLSHRSEYQKNNRNLQLQYTILKSDFETVSVIWKNHLWPERIEPIEATSALLFKEGIDLNYKSSKAFFIKAEANQKIIGVCSGHQTGSQEFRARGLWVSENFRRKGIGSKLFISIEKEAQRREGSRLWTLARHSSIKFYHSVGMKNFGKTYKFEYGPHFWMTKTLSST